MGCHAECAAYQSYHARREELSVQRLRDGDIIDGKRKAADRYFDPKNSYRAGRCQQ